jgi:starch-binding outer membrane protein SusE/F
MKNIFKLLLAMGIVFIYSSCSKVDNLYKSDPLPVYQNGVSPVLSSSVTTIASAPADSNNTAVTFSWTSPAYAQDTSLYKYLIEIDTANESFLSTNTKIITGQLSTSFTAREINDILLGYGFAFNVAHNIYVRLISSYGNNNEQRQSNIITLSASAYKIPPRVALPATNRLFIVGGATDFGWSNDAAPPFPAAREFARLEETQWAGIFNLKTNEAYKFLQEQGVWGSQFHMISGGNAQEGDFEQKDADPAFPAPLETGKYKITVNFQSGKFSTVKVDNQTPDELYVTGDAAADGWTNSPSAAQKFIRKNSAEFEITIALTAGKSFKFLSKYGDWHPQIGGTSATGGAIVEKYNNDDAPTASPAADGNYKITVNFATGIYSVEKL